ncbi:MAG: selenide, water dikinase SelD, partial [Candidatus Puniceispirillaceae bacterium]
KGVDPRYLHVSGIGLDYGSIPMPADNADITGFSQSVDFLSQHISDAYLFGRIAALHALSDVFVAGDRPIAAQAIVTLQRARPEMQKSDLTLMLCGALEELAAHHTQLIGGHTTVAGEAMLGFAVTGISQAKPALPALAEEDYLLLLSKPIGIGVILAAEMRGRCPPEAYDAAIATMLSSNTGAADLITKAMPSALMTDVTGFGLARHGLNLMQRMACSGMVLWPDKLPLIDGVQTLAEKNIRSSLYRHNRKDIHLQGGANLGAEYSAIIDLLFDPQTSGGVLAALPRTIATEICSQMQMHGYEQAAIIGKLSPRHEGIILEKEATGR